MTYSAAPESADESPELSATGIRSSRRAFVGLAIGGAVAGLGAVARPRAVAQRGNLQGNPAPEIGLPDTAGNQVRMAGLRGKVVLVDFWASWCAPCREEMPVLERFHQRYGERGLVVIGVNMDREASAMRGFLERSPVTFRIVHDGQHQVAGRYSPPRMPSSYFVDKRGVVRHVHAGFRSRDVATMERYIQELL